MEISERKEDGVVILTPLGKILLDDGDKVLKAKIEEHVEQGNVRLILDCSNIPYMDSGGLGEVVRSYTTVNKAGGNLVLVNTTNRIQDLLIITKLALVFEIFGDIEHAKAYFLTYVPKPIMTVEENHVGKIVILTCKAIPRESHAQNFNLAKAVLEMVKDGHRMFILHCDEAGANRAWLVNQLMNLKNRTIQKANPQIKLVITNLALHEKIQEGGINNIYKIFPSVAEAQKSFV